jgi:hypothetical protein
MDMYRLILVGIAAVTILTALLIDKRRKSS